MKIPENVRKNRLLFVEKFKIIKFYEEFPTHKEIKKPVCKTLRGWTQNKEDFENFQEILRFLIKISMEN